MISRWDFLRFKKYLYCIKLCLQPQTNASSGNLNKDMFKSECKNPWIKLFQNEWLMVRCLAVKMIKMFGMILGNFPRKTFNLWSFYSSLINPGKKQS